MKVLVLRDKVKDEVMLGFSRELETQMGLEKLKWIKRNESEKKDVF